MAESLGHQRSRGIVVPALALVYVEEDLNALVLLDAALEHAGGAALGGSLAPHLPGFGIVHGEDPVLQEL